MDPNVLVSGLIAQGPPAEVVDLVRYGEVRAAACPQLLAELEGVLRRPRVRIVRLGPIAPRWPLFAVVGAIWPACGTDPVGMLRRSGVGTW